MQRPARISLLIAAAIALTGCYPSQPDIATGEMILGMTDALNDLRTETAILQEQIDSLVAHSARQDSTIRRIAEQIGMTVAR